MKIDNRQIDRNKTNRQKRYKQREKRQIGIKDINRQARGKELERKNICTQIEKIFVHRQKENI